MWYNWVTRVKWLLIVWGTINSSNSKLGYNETTLIWVSSMFLRDSGSNLVVVVSLFGLCDYTSSPVHSSRAHDNRRISHIFQIFTLISSQLLTYPENMSVYIISLLLYTHFVNYIICGSEVANSDVPTYLFRKCNMYLQPVKF